MTPTLAPAPVLLWPHQARYRQVAQALAKDLFDALDEELKPFVILLALPTNPALPARCLEPEDCGLPADDFMGVVARGRQLQNATPWPYPERDDVSPAMLRRKHEGL